MGNIYADEASSIHADEVKSIGEGALQAKGVKSICDITLLPCPFCARQPQYTTRVASESERSPSKKIHFISCFCGGYHARAWQMGYTVAEVTKEWNTRSVP